MGSYPDPTDEYRDGLGMHCSQESGEGAVVGVVCVAFIFTLSEVQQKWDSGGGSVMVSTLYSSPEAILAILVYFIF